MIASATQELTPKQLTVLSTPFRSALKLAVSNNGEGLSKANKQHLSKNLTFIMSEHCPNVDSAMSVHLQ